MRYTFLCLLLIAFATGCGPREEPENRSEVASGAGVAEDRRSEQETSPTDTATPAAAVSRATVSFEPSAFEDCTPPKYVTAKITWDATASNVANVDVKTVGSDGTEGLFSTGAPVGSKESGPWMAPGSVIVLRDHETGEELARAVAAARPCGS